MTDLDLESIAGVRDYAKTVVLNHRKHLAMQPIREALLKNLMTMSDVTSDIMLAPTIQVRQSVLNLEAKIERFPAKQREAEELMEKGLEAIRGYTRSLEALLEKVS